MTLVLQYVVDSVNGNMFSNFYLMDMFYLEERGQNILKNRHNF